MFLIIFIIDSILVHLAIPALTFTQFAGLLVMTLGAISLLSGALLSMTNKGISFAEGTITVWRSWRICIKRFMSDLLSDLLTWHVHPDLPSGPNTGLLKPHSPRPRDANDCFQIGNLPWGEDLFAPGV